MKRKVYLSPSLGSVRFPITAILSIMHRITGVFLFIFIAPLLYFFEQSINSQASFDQMMQQMQHPLLRCLLWCFISCLLYHLLAGIRHMLLDMGIGDGRVSGKISAWFIILLSVFLSCVYGFYLI